MQASPESRALPRPFNPSGFEIVDGRFASHGEVTLWATGGLAPTRGELFTIARADAIHDLRVVEVKGHSPGWSALCRVVEAA
jgi:hypothetical protein